MPQPLGNDELHQFDEDHEELAAALREMLESLERFGDEASGASDPATVARTLDSLMSMTDTLVRYAAMHQHNADVLNRFAKRVLMAAGSLTDSDEVIAAYWRSRREEGGSSPT